MVIGRPRTRAVPLVERGDQGSKRSTHRRARAVVVVFVAALTLRLIAITRSYDIFIDEITYATIGRNLAGGHGLSLYGQPFTLHPPAMFGLDAVVIDVFGLHGSVVHLVASLRPVSAVLGSVACVGAYLLVERAAGPRAALLASGLLVLDPFTISYDSQLMLEAAAGAAAVAAFGLLSAAAQTSDRRSRRRYVMGAGLMTGIVVTTKDTFGLVVVVTLLVLLVSQWALPRREMARILLMGAGAYLVYLGGLASTGTLPDWWHANVDGLLRLVGVRQETGFNAPTVHVSLLSRAFANLGGAATSYLILAAGPVAAAWVLWSVRPWGPAWGSAPLREVAAVVLACWTLTATAYLVYATVFGSIEEQMYYILLGPAACSIAVAVTRPGRRHAPKHRASR